MNPIKVILTIGLCYFTIRNGFLFFKLREDLGNTTDDNAKSEMKKVRNDFIRSLVVAVVYILVAFA